MADKSALTKSVNKQPLAKKVSKAKAKTKADGTAAGRAVEVNDIQTRSTLSDGVRGVVQAQKLDAMDAYADEMRTSVAELTEFMADFSSTVGMNMASAANEYYGVDAIAAAPNNGIEVIDREPAS